MPDLGLCCRIECGDLISFGIRQQPITKRYNIRPLRCRARADDPIGEGGRNCFCQRSYETARFKVECRQGAPRQGQPLFGDRRIYGEVDVGEDRSLFWDFRINIEGGEPPPLFRAVLVVQKPVVR